MPRKVWKVKPANAVSISTLSDSLQVSPLIARLLIQRGAVSPEQAYDFLCADLDSLPPPALMSDLEKAVHLIRRAVSRQEKVMVVGDYDVDGLTSTAIVVRVLHDFGAGQGIKPDVTFYIPHRMTEGYGLKNQVVQQAAQSGIKLLITVDCGTTSFEELALAHRFGIETIVVDHHELLPAGRPPASAFLNPLQSGCRYPSKDLTSGGIAFTLARGLLDASQSSRIWDYLDLVALSTVADLAPLVGENRILVRAGLHRLQGTRKPGLRALLIQTKLDRATLTSEDISYSLAPRLNAMGRLGSAEASLRLLITEEPEEARIIVKAMDKENRSRAALEREAFNRALAKVEREVNFSRDRVIVLEDEKWHPGVVGIIATRLMLRFYRPTVVIALTGPVCRGSARSIQTFSLVEALSRVKEHLIEFGGHPAAAGLTIARDRINAFREALNQVAHDWIDPHGLTPCLEADGELPLSQLTEGVMRDIDVLAPFGVGNPRPVFISNDARVPNAPGPEVLRNRRPFSLLGIPLVVQDPQGRSFEALQPRRESWDGFNFRRFPGGSVKLAYSPARSRTRENLKIELRLRDLKLPS